MSNADNLLSALTLYRSNEVFGQHRKSMLDALAASLRLIAWAKRSPLPSFKN